MSEPDPQPVEETAPVPPRIRWAWAKWIVGIYVVVVLLIRVVSTVKDNDTVVGVAITICSMLAAVALMFWWVLLSRARWKLRVGVLIGLLVFVSMFEVQGFSGGFFPTIVFRFQSAVKPERPATNAADTPFDQPTIAEYDWAEFRGPKRDGVVRGASYSEAWHDPEQLWRIPVGEGWSSFAVVGALAFTQWQEGEHEVTVCLEATTAREVWRHTDDVRFDEAMGGPGPRATPTYADGRLFALGATGILNCFEATTGALTWSVNILDDAQAGNIQWAMSASPLVISDRVIVSPGGRNHENLIAYDVATGERAWAAGTAVASYSSPQLATLAGQEQILIFNARGLHAHAVEDGAQLWSYDFSTQYKICVAQPGVIDGKSILLSLGYGVGSLMLDVEEADGEWTISERWRSLKLRSKFNDFVIHGDHAYGFDEGVMTCIELATGNRAWKGIRAGYGQLILVGSTLVVLSEKGEVIFVRATPDKADELGRFKAISGKTWNHPVIARGHLFVRNAREAACFQLP